VEDDWEDTRVFAFNPHESRFVADPATLVAVPEDVAPAEMTLLPTLETATSLVLDGRPRIGERVVVFGAGVVGLLTIALLSRFPLERLVAVEPIEARRERALAFGADEAVSPDVVPSLFDAEDVDDPSGADLLYELSGRPAALDDALDATGYDSRVIVGSWYGTKPVRLDLGTEFHRNRVSLASSQVSTLAPETTGRFSKDRRLDVALDRLREIDVASLITHRIPFADAPDAYRLLDESPETAVQVLLTYE
jgi:threonine dehydrogenase-like Zn-dependent dehydrogenase